jgi:hypothetical protein
MTLERSAVIMDEIFASPEEEGRGRLLKIIQDFLVSEAAKHIAKEKGMCLRCPSFLLFKRSCRVCEGQTKDRRREYGTN